jgi:hypothetical protein
MGLSVQSQFSIAKRQNVQTQKNKLCSKTCPPLFEFLLGKRHQHPRALRPCLFVWFFLALLGIVGFASPLDKGYPLTPQRSTWSKGELRQKFP